MATQERAARTAKTAANQAADTTTEAAREAAERFQAGAKTFQDASERLSTAGNQAFKETVERSLSTLNQLNDVSKKNLEAVVASIGAATRGAEAIGAQAMSYSKSSVEQGVDAARALSAVKSVQEAVELQTNFARTALETYLAEMNRMSETVAASVKESLAPLNERATAAMETLQSTR
ncbi:MAG TPA: TIGR01841 family phasin [Brevundimonas sp.]